MSKSLLPDFQVEAQGKIVHITYDAQGIYIQIKKKNSKRVQAQRWLLIRNRVEVMAHTDHIKQFLRLRLGERDHELAFEHVFKLLKEKFNKD